MPPRDPAHQRQVWHARYPWIAVTVDRLAAILIGPLLIAYRLRLISYLSVGQILSVQPGTVGVILRRAWYRATLQTCGAKLHVGFGAIIACPESRIGDNCSLGDYTRLGLVDIGAYFVSAHHVSIPSGRYQHAFDRRDIPVSQQPTTRTRVTVGTDVWVGAQAFIGTDVASHSVIGASAVVTHTFPEWSILAGVPARVLRSRP